MTKSELLNWADFCKIPMPMSPVKMKIIASVLTRNGFGTVLCPKCYVLNIVKGELRSYCGFTANIIYCACGCADQLLDKDNHGNSRQYTSGHNSRGENNGGWKGGRIKRGKYWYVQRPDHPFVGKQGYVAVHGEEYTMMMVMKRIMKSVI